MRADAGVSIGRLLGLRDQLTHRGNVRDSRYGWLRLTPMYSVHLVDELLAADLGGGGRVLDPFCGTGTTALVCAERGVACDTTDINPFLLWLARAKAHAYGEREIGAATGAAGAVRAAALDAGRGREWVPPLANIEKWWEPPVLDALSRAWAEARERRGRAGWLLTVAFLRAAIRTAHVSFGHQSMSFRTASRSDDGARLVADEWDAAVASVTGAARSPVPVEPRVLRCDARALTAALPLEAYAAVVTSPPYCNRMSYIRELRPYMYWTGHLADGRAAGELDWRAIGGTWGVATSNVARWEAGAGAVEVPFDGFETIVERISASSDVLGRYVAKYFHDVVLHVRELVLVVRPGGRVHYVVGNSKFYDELVPTEAIYAAVFDAAGLDEVTVRAIRKRTSKKELYEFLVSARRP